MPTHQQSNHMRSTGGGPQGEDIKGIYADEYDLDMSHGNNPKSNSLERGAIMGNHHGANIHQYYDNNQHVGHHKLDISPNTTTIMRNTFHGAGKFFEH